MASAAPPKAVKAFVTSVLKDQLLESDTDWQQQPEVPLLGLLQCELVQRGVLISVNSNDISTWNWTKVLDTVVAVIGKGLLEEGGSLPTPLLAGSNVMAGRTAELCASLVANQQSLTASLQAVKPSLTTALKRCQEVKDTRFQVLLELLNTIAKEDFPDKDMPSSLRQMALGYYLRGAKFQPDTPPMWKKAYDVILVEAKRQNDYDNNMAEEEQGMMSPSQAAWPLHNMARIATSKGNTQRATELSVKCAESYLQMAIEQLKANTNNTNQKLEEAFLKPYLPTISKPLEQAQEQLQSCQQNFNLLSREEQFTTKLLDVQIQLQLEATQMESEAQRAFQQAQNRATEPTGNKGKSSKTTATPKKPPTLDSLRAKTRQQFLADGNKNGLTEAASTALRDAYLETKSSTSNRQRSAAKTLSQVLNRYQDQAQAMALLQKDFKGWNFLLNFVNPFWDKLLNSKSENDDNPAISSMEIEELDLMEICACLVPTLQFMLVSETISLDVVSTTHQVVVKLLEHARQAKKDYQAASKVLKTSTEPMDLHIQKLESASMAVEAILVQRYMGTHSAASDLQQCTERAIKSAQQQRQTDTPHFGTGFWNLVVAWGGFDLTPWSYCTAPEARIVIKQAQQCLQASQKSWGRPIAPIEQYVADLAAADAECGLLSGGLPHEALHMYQDILNRTSNNNDGETGGVSNAFASLIRSHCYMGMARVQLMTESSAASFETPSELAKQSLAELEPLQNKQDLPLAYLWTVMGATVAFARHHLTTARQLVAETLLRSGRTEEAKSFLQEAVRDAPTDPEAAFSLGAFLLRDANTKPEMEAAKLQLLKAAKLDSRKAGPFALLGIWYERQGDKKRALGCYSKALLLDPPNPVAGRGVLRLTKWDAAASVLDTAMQASSPLNGWAWRALGNHKVMVTGESDLGAIALLKALRCRDIDQPQNELLASFFHVGGDDTSWYLGKEKAESWSELAFCYRRLGRYTAAIRGYYSAMEAAADHVTGSMLCSCAEAELGLGLAEEACEKFKLALENTDSTIKLVAAYGQGTALLSLAQRDNQDGKAGAAFQYLQRAVEEFESIEETKSFGCSQKLLGDLHSFGASLPPDVFGGIEKQIAFVEKGEASYRVAIECCTKVSNDRVESKLLQAATIADVGASLLLQAQLAATHHNKGLALSLANVSPDVAKLYDKAATEFRRAIDLCPDYAPAWCGLGCSLVVKDPLLSQHAFCRSIQLDNLAPDSYSNLGFLYTSHDAFDASKGVLDALTQVADSPMMWINRAMILERHAEEDLEKDDNAKAEECISQAADAYRAALQVVKHPSAMLGLAITCRLQLSKSHKATSGAFQESYGYLLEYEGTTGSPDVPASLVENLYTIERGIKGYSSEDSRRLTEEGKASAFEKLQSLETFEKENDDGTIKGLDLKLIRSCLEGSLVAQEGEESKEEIGAITAPTASLARQIVHEPNRGDLWVDLAKQLFRDCGGAPAALESAYTAACRAVRILTHQLSSSSSSSAGGPTGLSDALALKHWLANLRASEKNDRTADETKPCRTLLLQKALMICPNNKFAREALTIAMKAT